MKNEKSSPESKPFLTKVGLDELKSMTVDGFALPKSPTSITKSTSFPICLKISCGFDKVSSLVRFALVVVIGKRLASDVAIL